MSLNAKVTGNDLIKILTDFKVSLLDLFENKEHKVYNVAADAHDCKPVEIEQIIKDIKEIE